MNTATRMMVSPDGGIGMALNQELDQQHAQLENIQCALECLARGTDENELRGTLQLLSDCVGRVKHSIFAISTNLSRVA